jgi:hypothetical protein
MATTLPDDPDEILSFEPMPDGGIRVLFKDGSEQLFCGEDADQIATVLQHVTPPSA